MLGIQRKYSCDLLSKIVFLQNLKTDSLQITKKEHFTRIFKNKNLTGF